MSDEQDTNRDPRQGGKKSRALLPPSLLGGTAAEAPAEAKTVDVSLAERLLIGAAAIKEWLGLPDEKQVYNLRDRGYAPIFQVSGLGLAALKDELEQWIYRSAKEDLARRQRRRNRKI